MRTGERKRLIDFEGRALEETGDLIVRLCGMSVRRRENGVQGVMGNKRDEKQDGDVREK
jgi:hypothetical protein